MGLSPVCPVPAPTSLQTLGRDGGTRGEMLLRKTCQSESPQTCRPSKHRISRWVALKRQVVVFFTGKHRGKKAIPSSPGVTEPGNEVCWEKRAGKSKGLFGQEVTSRGKSGDRSWPKSMFLRFPTSVSREGNLPAASSLRHPRSSVPGDLFLGCPWRRSHSRTGV